MSKFCAVLCLALLAFSAPLPAQQSATSDLQQQMTESEFKAAGLDKLSPAELSALNAWLQRKVSAETAVAVEHVREQAKEEGRKEVVEKNRGFFHFGSTDPIESSIAGEFSGFAKGKRYTLENGQVWQQTDDARLAGIRRTDPKVSIKPGLMGVWYLRIDGFNTSAKVQRIE